MSGIRRTTTGRILLALAMVALLGAGGCRSSDPSAGGLRGVTDDLLPKVQDPQRLAADLAGWVGRSVDRELGFLTTVAAETKDPALRERSLRSKLVTITTSELILREPEPRLGFVLAWVLSAQWTKLVEDQHGGTWGEWAGEATRIMREEGDALLAIGKRHFGEEWIAKTSPEVEAYAARHPITEHLYGDVRAGQRAPPPSGRSAIEQLVSVPLSPFSGLQGVGDTPEAIRGFTQVAARFEDTTRRLPMRTRWELEVLFYEIQASESARKTVESLERASQAMESLSRSAETLPEDLRKESEALVASATEAQDSFRATMEEAQKTLQALDSTIVSLNRTVKEGEVTAARIAEAGGAWEKAGTAVNEVLLSYAKIAGSEAAEADPEPEGPDDIDRITSLAQEFRLASEDLRLLLQDLEAGKLDDALARTGKSVDASVDHASARAAKLADVIAIRAVAVLAVGFVLLLAYRFAWRRLSSSQRP